MAEYIKLDAIMEYCQNQKDKNISCNDLARFPTSDVIERSKIDEAIKEMERYSTSFEYANRRDISKAVDYCIGVIQGTIGE